MSPVDVLPALVVCAIGIAGGVVTTIAIYERVLARTLGPVDDGYVVVPAEEPERPLVERWAATPVELAGGRLADVTEWLALDLIALAVNAGMGRGR